MSHRSVTTSAPVQASFRGHITELDGLRAVGLCFVLLHHFSPERLPLYAYQIGNLGWVAMDSFFVMSGFLITGILLDSREKPNFFSTYYVRRALRIFPLYYAVLLIWYGIIRYANWGNDYRALVDHWGSPMWFTFYAGNIREAMVSAWPNVWGYGPLWSLQIEEQFYLLFPLAVAWLSREQLRRLMLAAIVLSPTLRVAAYLWRPENTFLQYVLLPCHCEGLAFGALIAIRFRSGPWKISKPLLSACTALLLGGACLGSVLSTWGTRNEGNASQWDRLAGYSISSAGCACLVLWLVCFRGSSYTAWLRTAPMRYVGKISYGIYMLHALAAWTLWELAKKRILHFHKDDPLFYFGGACLSVVYAAISWHFFEGPLLKVKDRISHYRGRLVAAEVSN
jgi:peptidoglycan/LPS O-acetylase OafA/YrhL